jgi:methylglyoxal synthase
VQIVKADLQRGGVYMRPRNIQIEGPRWPERNRSDFDALGLVASRRYRRRNPNEGPTVTILLEEFPEVLGKRFLFATWGTYFDSILDEAIRRDLKKLNDEDPFAAYRSRDYRWESRYDYLRGYVLRPGKRGGILETTEHLEKSASTDRVKTLIFLADPEDLEESYPEDRALVRSAIRNDVLYLPTLTSALNWLAFESSASQGNGRQLVKRTVPENETLALIAHDEKKLDLCRWVVQHQQYIRRFDRFITTGTTGEKIGDFLKALGIPDRKIQRMDKRESGPKGGDVEIGGEILRGNCHHVVFFVDPMTTHPHEADIQALLRVCAMPDVRVNLRLTESSATSWIKTVAESSDKVLSPAWTTPRGDQVEHAAHL